MVHVRPHKDVGQVKCEKPPTRYVSLGGGSDPIASEPTNEPILTQWICNPIWSRPTHGTGVAGRLVCPTTRKISRAFWQKDWIYCTWFLKVSLVSKMRQRNFASFTTFIGVFPRRMLASGKSRTVGESECILSWRWRTWSRSLTPTLGRC